MEVLKKQKSKKAVQNTDSQKDQSKAPDKGTTLPEGKDVSAEAPAEATKGDDISKLQESKTTTGDDVNLEDNDNVETETSNAKPVESQDQTPTTPRAPHGRQPSLSIQSKMRSSSFRNASGSAVNVPTSPVAATGLAPLTPEGNSMGEIYRKQAARLEELERENKRLVKDLDASENRWRKAEEELEELRSNSAQIAELKIRAERSEGKADEAEKLVRSIWRSFRQFVDSHRTSSYKLSNGRTLIYNPYQLNLAILKHLLVYH